MIIVSEPVFPKKAYALKKPRKEILKELEVIEGRRQILLRKQKGKKKEKEEPKIKEYEFIIFTDGGFNKEYSVGSWSYVIKVKEGKKHFKLHKDSGTLETDSYLPILMEIKAVIYALKFIGSKQEILNYKIKNITVCSDSKQVINSNDMFERYKENDWFYLVKGYEMVESLKEAWTELYTLNKEFKVNYLWVRGHSGNLLNERCDQVCTTRIRQDIREKRIIEYNNDWL